MVESKKTSVHEDQEKAPKAKHYTARSGSIIAEGEEKFPGTSDGKRPKGVEFPKYKDDEREGDLKPYRVLGDGVCIRGEFPARGAVVMLTEGEAEAQRAGGIPLQDVERERRRDRDHVRNDPINEAPGPDEPRAV